MNSPTFGDAAVGLDVLQHVQASFVGATVGRAPQASYASRDRCEGVGARRTAQTHGGSRSVLLVVSVQDEDAVQRRSTTGLTLYSSQGLPNIMRMKLPAYDRSFLGYM
jgi:hypothetical protein